MKNRERLTIAFDFDGTMVTHEYPHIGETLPLAVPTLLALQKNGHQLMLFTMRSDKELDYAVQYLHSLGLNNFWINQNPTQKSWTDSKKQYANYYIDDAAIGCPLSKKKGKRDFVNWEAILDILKDKNLITQNDYDKVLGIKFTFIKYKEYEKYKDYVENDKSTGLLNKYICPKDTKQDKFFFDIFHQKIKSSEVRFHDMNPDTTLGKEGYKKVIWEDASDGVDIVEHVLGYIKFP